MRPVIGITPAFETISSRLFLRSNYLEAVVRAGGLPVILPLTSAEADVEELVILLHGLVLTGGGDVDPAHFGEQPHPGLKEVQPLRDWQEMKLARLALGADIPLLGICRGIQIMNVALGGSLYQDLPDQRPGGIEHFQMEPRTQTTHNVKVEGNSRLKRIVKTQPSESLNHGAGFMVNSLHHQAVKELAGGFIVSAWAPDGVIEGIEAPGHLFYVGVQWHPEDLYDIDETSRALFSALVDASRHKMNRR